MRDHLVSACRAAALGAGLVIAARPTAWACSGPGAMDRILGAELLGWVLLAATAVLLIVAGALARRWRRRWRRLWPVPLLIGLHPGWWLSARHGDCGAMLALGSLAVTMIAVVTAIFLVVLARRAARAPHPSASA
jgi:hypothetical protein